jgi:serine/threonine protein phosphatase PrpC
MIMATFTGDLTANHGALSKHGRPQMGQVISSPEDVMHAEARALYDDFLGHYSNAPDHVRRSRLHKQLLSQIGCCLKSIPAKSRDINLRVSGADIGPIFTTDYLPHISLPPHLTKVQFRNVSFAPADGAVLANFLRRLPLLVEFDISENKFGPAGAAILRAAIGHPSLTTLYMTRCDLTREAWVPIWQILTTSRTLRNLCLAPIELPRGAKQVLADGALGNLNLTLVELGRDLADVCQYVMRRNQEFSGILNDIIEISVRRRLKVESQKSVKGREYFVGRARSTARLSANSQLVRRISEAESRATTADRAHRLVERDQYRSGQAEMCGRRERMEDISIILEDSPKAGNFLFGLFDGHGGREAAEYAAGNLPKALAAHLARSPQYEDAYVTAFRQMQDEMAPWCVYCGTTVVIAVIDHRTLTVANVGDSAAVLSRNGQAMRLSTDHKADNETERAYIISHGGTVSKDHRVNGMLAVSRALGDGFLLSAANPTPSIRRVQLATTDRFLILACDGVWDVITDQEACDLIATENDPLRAAERLKEEAYERDSLDNISVIVVDLHAGSR